MNHIRTTILVLTLLLFSLPAMAETLPLGVAGDYNTFIFNDFHGSSDTQGRLAVGGNAYLDHYSVGDMLPPDTTGDVLVVGGDLHFTGGRVYYGDARVGGDAYLPGYQLQDGDLYANAELSIDFEAEAEYLTQLSGSLSQLDSNAEYINHWGGLRLYGDYRRDLQVFNLDGNELMSSHGLTLEGVAAEATILINVSGENVGLTNMGLETLAPFGSNILFNFYEAQNLNLSGVGIHGSILAPWADVTNPQGVINGTLIASSFSGQMQQNYNPFEGELPTPPTAVPEPSTMVLLGLGLLSLVGLRARRS